MKIYYVILIVLDNPEDKLTIKKLSAEVFQEELKEALSKENSSRGEDRMLRPCIGISGNIQIDYL